MAKSTIILPDDPEWNQPIVMGNPYGGKTPKTAQEKWIKEHDGEQQSGLFKYAASTIANHPDPWMKTAQMSGVNTMMTNPMWFSPLHTPQNWQIASKRREVYQWNRFWYDNEPKVAAAIDFYCFTADTQVLMANGTQKAISNIEIGDMVRSHDGSSNRVVRKFERYANEDIVKIFISGVSDGPLKASETHKIKVFRDGNVTYAQASDLIPGDVLISPVDYDENELGPKINQDLCWILGLYAAEGCGIPYEHISKDGRIEKHFKGVYFTLAYEEKDTLAAELQERVRRYYGKESHLHVDKDNGICRVAVYGKDIADDLHGLCPGTSSHGTKRFAPMVMTWSSESLRNILGGFMSGDGCFNKSNGLQGVGISKSLCEQIANICDRLSLLYSFTATRLKDTRQVCYNVRISRRCCDALLDVCSKIKDINIAEGKGCYQPYEIRDGYLLRKIRKIEKEHFVGKLYDIEVANTHTYIAHRIACSNSRFPMNGFRLECPSKKILSFFEHFIVKKLKLNEIFKQISSEYFMLGDVFVHLNVSCPKCNGSGKDPETGDRCDHAGGIFNRIVILNPDWIEVQQSPLVDEPQIALNPDEELKNIVFYKQPRQIYDRIPDFIKNLVIQGKPIPLSNRTTHHLKHMPVPYGTYGTSLSRRLFTTLAYKTKIMTANWIVAERLILPVRVVKVGNDNRPASSADIADIQQQLAASANDPNLTIVTHHAFEYEWYGACYSHDTEVLTENGWKLFNELEKDEKVATYNQKTGSMEYQLPTEYHEYDFASTDSMKMYHFKSKQVDLFVTPNHRMLVNRNGALKEVYSQEVKHNDKLLSTCSWEGCLPERYDYENSPLSHLGIEDYLTFAGYYLSEGGLQIERNKGLSADKRIRTCNIGQNRMSPAYADMKNIIGKVYSHYSEKEDNRGNDTYCSLIVNSTAIAKHMALNFGSHAHNKRIPKWIKNLPAQYLKYLYNAMMAGDGDIRLDRSTPRYRYTTTSRVLADDFSEICLKLGFFSRTSKEEYVKISTHRPIYRIYLSERRKNTPFTLRDKHIHREDYNGKVYCVKVPNSWLFVRRNGWINVCGNTGKILQVTQELEWIGKEILDGFMLNQSLLNGEMCIPEQDQMLTLDGLKSLSEITENDYIATYNKDKGTLEYQKPTAIHVYDYDGELVHFKTDRLDFACTPNHKMLFQKRDHTEWTVDIAKNVRNRARFVKNLKWDRGVPEEIKGNHLPDKYQIGSVEIPRDEYLKIVAYYLTEGHIGHETRKSRSTYKHPISVYMSQSEKGKGWNELCSLQKTCTSYRIKKSTYGFAVYNKELAHHLSSVYGELSHGKHIPSLLKSYPVEELKKFLGYLINGDGSLRTRDKNGPKKYYTYFTKSRRLRDDVMEIALKCGYFPRFRKRRTIWEITFSDYDLGQGTIPLDSKKHETITSMPYKGKVWCVTVPNGFIVSERNGKLMVSGNSGYQSAQVGVETLIRRIESWRHTLAEWAEEHIFKPVAEMHGFIDEEKSAEVGEKVFLYPTIKWNDLELKDKTQWHQLLVQLHDKQVISTQTLMEELHLNYDQEVKRMRYEQMQAGPGGAPMGAAGGMGGGAGGMGAAGGGAAAPSIGGDMGMGGGMGMGAPVGGMVGDMGGSMGGDAGGGMGTAAGGMKVMKKGKGEKREEMPQVPMAFVKLTQIEQKMAAMLEDVANANKMNPAIIRSQFPIENPRGGKRFQLDFAIPNLKIGIECLTPGNLVQTDRGSQPVETITTDDHLVGRHGSYVDIKNLIVNEHNGDVLRIKPYGMLPFTVTPTHPLLVCSPIRTKVIRQEPAGERIRYVSQPSSPRFISASEIKQGDYLVIPKRKWSSLRDAHLTRIELSQYNSSSKSSHKLPDHIATTVDFGWLLGICAAEGLANIDRDGVEFSFHKKEIEIIDRLQRTLKEVFNLETQLIPSKKDNGIRVVTCSTALARFMVNSFGKNAPHKHLPGWMMECSNEFKRAFLEGYCDGDGCIRNYDGASRFASSSPALLTDAQALVFSMGFWGTIVKSRDPGLMSILGREHETAGLWELTVNFMGQQKRQYREDDTNFYVPIKNIVTEQYTGLVYNFETACPMGGNSNHTYCVGNVVSHNCDGEVWHSTQEQEMSDQERDYLLAQRGWTILRFDDKVIDDAPQSVKQTLNKHIHEAISSKGKKAASTAQESIHLFTKKGDSVYDLGSQYEKYFANQGMHESGQIGTRENWQNIKYENNTSQSEIFKQ